MFLWTELFTDSRFSFHARRVFKAKGLQKDVTVSADGSYDSLPKEEDYTNADQTSVPNDRCKTSGTIKSKAGRSQAKRLVKAVIAALIGLMVVVAVVIGVLLTGGDGSHDGDGSEMNKIVTGILPTPWSLDLL